MPFYEYECPACRYYLEVLQKISDRPLKKCPSCGKTGLKRLMSAPVFRLKGSGWYETDFKSDKEGQRNLAGAEREEAKPAAAESGKATGEDKAAGVDKAAAKTEAPAAAKGGSESKAAAEPARTRKATVSGRASAGKTVSAGKAAAKRAPRRPARPAARRKGRR